MKSSFELSNYQKTILDYVDNRRDNLLIDAKAGSGKTSTLLLISNRLVEQGNKCLFLAFNKSIVEELTNKIDDSENCLVKTIHSLGFSFIRSYLYRKHKTNYELKVDTTRLKKIVEFYYEKFCQDDINTSNFMLAEDELKELHSNLIRDLVTLTNFSRYYNVNYKKENSLLFLVPRIGYELENHINEIPKYQDVVIHTIDELKYRFENPEKNDMGQPTYSVDFTDMIYFPLYYDMQVPYSIRDYLDTVMVDESQDMSILQQKFVGKLNTSINRFIFVGDKFQAIYGFAGADNNSIDNIKKNFTVSELPLNICYRCPEKVIKIAQGIVPTIESNPKREDKGIVNIISKKEMFNMVVDEDMIIGRKNKDLLLIFRTFLVNKHKKVKFKNKEMVSSLVNSMEDMIKTYIKRYNKGLNVEKALDEYIKSMDYHINAKEITKIVNGLVKKEEKYDEIDICIIDDCIEKYKELCIENTANKKILNRQKYNIDYLKLCMEEYKEKGLYSVDRGDDLSEFYSVFEMFLEDYEKTNTSVLVTNFIEYVRDFLSSTLNDKVPIISSVHAMKGGEADRVFILDYPAFPYTRKNMTTEQVQQEVNLQYVAITRAKKELYLIELDIYDEKGTLLEDCVKTNKKCKNSVNYLLRDKKPSFKDIESLNI